MATLGILFSGVIKKIEPNKIYKKKIEYIELSTKKKKKKQKQTNI